MTRKNDDLLARFESWYRAEVPRLFNYVSYRVRDEEIAQELTATICERALSRLHQYDPDRGVLTAWIFGIARNALCDHFRELQNSPKPIALDKLPEIRARERSPEEVYEAIEAFRLVVNHIDQLTETEQEVLALRYGADLPNAEIAQVTGLTPNYVGVILHRAIAKLREAVLLKVE